MENLLVKALRPLCWCCCLRTSPPVDMHFRHLALVFLQTPHVHALHLLGSKGQILQHSAAENSSEGRSRDLVKEFNLSYHNRDL